MQKLLSVIVLTYNHRDYITAALDSIQNQTTEFDFEVIIADDASTDGTPAIILSHIANWKGRHAQPVCLFRESNMGMQRNALDAISRTQGKYIAFLEGDDYWMDAQKLSLQVRFLESNPEYYLCAHRTMIQIGNKIHDHEWRLNQFRVDYSVHDYLDRIFFHTSAIVVRARRDFPKWMVSIRQFDQAFVLLSSDPSAVKIRVIPRNLSVYRLHSGGITQSADHQNKRITQWSHIRLLCGVARECPWIKRRYVINKLREVVVQQHLHSASTLLALSGVVINNIHIILRLCLYRYIAAKMKKEW